MIDQHLADYLDQVDIIDRSGIKCGSAFYFFLDDSIYDDSFIKAIIRIFRELFSDRMRLIKCRDKEKKPIMFFYSNTYRGRNDYRIWFDNVLSLCDSYDLLTSSFPCFRVRNLALISIEIKLIRILNYYYQDLHKAICMSSKLFSYIKDFECAKRYVDRYAPSLIVTFCDFHPADSLLTQYCVKKNIATASLQHGSYIGAVDIPQHSFSKYMLCHGTTTENFFKNNGCHQTEFIKTGMPQLIYKGVKNTLAINNNRVIGLIFSGAEWDKYDIEMLLVARKFCEENPEYNICVKCHPGYGPEKYQNYLENEEVIVDQITITDFMERCELILVSVSTVFIECLLNMVPVFVYDKDDIFYPEAKNLKFSDEKGLQTLLDKMHNDPEMIAKDMMEIRNLSTETVNVADNYKCFFDKF